MTNATFTTAQKIGDPQWEITENPTSNDCQTARKVGKSAVSSKSEKSGLNKSPEFPSGKSLVPTFRAVKIVYSHWELGISDFPSGSECSIRTPSESPTAMETFDFVSLKNILLKIDKKCELRK